MSSFTSVNCVISQLESLAIKISNSALSAGFNIPIGFFLVIFAGNKEF
jgi:hypothetical protein